MITVGAVEGMVNDMFRFHYDLFTDVLCLRLLADMHTPSLGNETDDGIIELREESTRRLIGLTIVSWWKRFGQGPLPDSLQAIASQIEPLAIKVAA